MANHQILGYTNPIGSNCSPLITIIKCNTNKVCAQFPDSSIRPLAIKGNSYRDIKGLIPEHDKGKLIRKEEYSYVDFSGMVVTRDAKNMLPIIAKDLEALKVVDIDMYEILNSFYLQEQKQLLASVLNKDKKIEEGYQIIPTIITRSRSKKHTKQIIKRPIISEKSERLSDDSDNPKFSFVVDKKANKIEISKAVESMFDVSVKKVNTLIMPSKRKSINTRSGAMVGKVSSYKKAIVTLFPNETIDFYGGLYISEKVA